MFSECGVPIGCSINKMILTSNWLDCESYKIGVSLKNAASWLIISHTTTDYSCYSM